MTPPDSTLRAGHSFNADHKLYLTLDQPEL